ncbi:MAG: hypothetical protein JRN26_03010 [Nitrososphaerota archaeon]|jgi:hypothetical protein|nr:hypothetical protein [Nitrososphaerota archaeon]MDG6935844.1 hypothetical protein [Nitrososphaerota archaeon]MDG6944165.1 hypothetical protein [Nitrososphaerota archaeon]
MAKGQENEFEDITGNLDFYMATEEGRAQLVEITKKRERRFMEELMKFYRPQRDVIWMNPHCEKCIYYVERKGARCELNNARLVKPFYGRAIWDVLNETEMSDFEVKGIDWEELRIQVAQEIVDEAMKKINDGRPYSCFSRKGN